MKAFRVGQVWELKAHLGSGPRAGLIVGFDEQKSRKVNLLVWRVLMISGEGAGRELEWHENLDSAFEDHTGMERLA